MSMHPSTLPFSRILALLLLAAVLTALAACGKRDWPSPKVSEDRFRWRTVTVLRNQGCIILDCELSGAWQNVESVRLMLESVGTGPNDGCASCPFTPRITRLYAVNSPNLRRDMNRMVLTACDLDPKKTYRVQLLVTNIYPTLDPVVSELLLSAPQ